MHKLSTLRETLCEELEKVAKKDDITTSDLETIDKLAHSIKNIDKILDEDMRHSYGYSGYNSGAYDRSYDYSYARRGRDGDSDGRYNEGRSRDYSMGEYSREGNHRMVEKLRQMMETSNDKDRDAIMRCIRQLENE